MKVMLVNGSPHKAGSTNRALEEVARTLEAEGAAAAPNSAAARSTTW